MFNRKKLAGLLGICCFIAHGQLLSDLPWSRVITIVVVAAAGNGLYWWSMSGDE
jgi:hypothetical protein